MTRIEVRRCREADIDSLVGLASRNGVATTREDLRGEIERQLLGSVHDDRRFFLRLVAESRGEIVGTGFGRPSVFTPTGRFVVGVQVDADQRRQGIGTKILNSLEQQIGRRGGFGLEARIGTRDPTVYKWAFARGFRHFIDELRCELDITDAPSSPLGIFGEPLPGVSFFTLAETAEGSGLSRLYDLTATLLAEIPEIAGAEGPSEEAVRSFFTDRTSLVPEATWVASMGQRWVGTTVSAEHGDGKIYTWFTGVDPGLAGRGIATALKVRAIESARSLGVRRMIADVASTNAAMLAVNRRLGYEISSSLPVLRKSLSA